MNNCGPATLSMALSYWGWVGDQREPRAFLRPNFAAFDDKNVRPSEMAAYVESQIAFQTIFRVGGSIDSLKRLVVAGFPIIIEKGFQPPKEDWMGHYELVTGYDDLRNHLRTQDVYIMPDFPVPYPDLTEQWWRDFNHVFLVVYPLDCSEASFFVLGSYVDTVGNYVFVVGSARLEVETLNGGTCFSRGTISGRTFWV